MGYNLRENEDIFMRVKLYLVAFFSFFDIIRFKWDFVPNRARRKVEFSLHSSS